jgi:hypothetical protein
VNYIERVVDGGYLGSKRKIGRSKLLMTNSLDFQTQQFTGTTSEWSGRILCCRFSKWLRTSNSCTLNTDSSPIDVLL